MNLSVLSEYGAAVSAGSAWPSTVILRLLTSYVRIIGDYQLRGLKRAAARKLLHRLEDQGLVKLKTAMVLPEIPLQEPVFTWRPGHPTPNAGRLAWQLSSRWKGTPRPVLVASATTKAVIETGGPIGGRPLRRTEICHDLHVTALYLNFCSGDSERARLWRHEDAACIRRTAGVLVPDALVGETAIEFGGRYRAEKLQVIHRGHAMVNRPYEIW